MRLVLECDIAEWRPMPAGDERPIEYWSTPMIKGRRIELLDEMGLHPFGNDRH